MKKYIVFLLFFTNSIVPYNGRAQKISAITSNGVAIGTGYQTDKENFVGIGVTGTSTNVGVAQSTFSFSQSLSEKEAEDELGFSVGGKARFGAYQLSAAAKFARNSISTSYSVSSVWVSDYIFPSKKLIDITKTKIGVEVFEHHWDETCGDRYVEEIGMGAKLFFSIRVDFNSLESKNSFTSEFNLTGPLVEAKANMAEASRRFEREAKITVSAFQVGGDVSKLTAIFGYSDTSAYRIAQFSLGDFDKCSALIQTAIAYSANTKTGFPSQLAPGVLPGPAPLYYNLAKYSNAGIFPPNAYPGLSILIERARQKLSDLFEEQLSFSLITERLLDLNVGTAKRTKLTQQQAIIERNLKEIVAASKICYETPEKSMDAVESVRSKLVSVDQKALDLPPIATADFRVMTTNGGVLSREESVSLMNEEVNIETGPGKRKKTLNDIQENGNEASAVLNIQGSSLKEAVLFFENIKLKVIPLQKGTAKFGAKVGDAFALIVTNTTRTFPKWLDVDIKGIRDSLMRSVLPNAEGTFYVIVKDLFNRMIRFDIEYSKWTYSLTNDPGDLKDNINYLSYINWWDKKSNGILGTIRNDCTVLEKSPERKDTPFTISPEWRTIATIPANKSSVFVTFLGKVQYNHVRPLDCRLPALNDIDFNKSDLEATPGGGVQFKTKLMPVIMLQFFNVHNGVESSFGQGFNFTGSPIIIPKSEEQLVLKAKMDLNWMFSSENGSMQVHPRAVDDKDLHIWNHIRNCDAGSPLKTVVIQ